MNTDPQPKQPNLVQSKNPRTNRYVLIDRAKGAIVGHKEDEGPYEGVPIAKSGRAAREHSQVS